MSKYFSDYNLQVITNIISGVQTYGQRYSTERNWGDFTQAYANTANEVSITIGWAANYGNEARRLLQLIQTDYPADFQKNDTANIAEDIKKSFVSKPYYQPKKNSNKAKAIINIITSEGGKKSQDKLFGMLIENYLDSAIDFGINKNNIPALMMWCQICHLGGVNPAKRIFNRSGKNPTLYEILAALRKDQENGNTAEVGDKIFESRHSYCAKWIQQYAQAQNEGGITQIMDFSKYYGKISNSGHDQRGKYSGGYAGDQTGQEWAIINWYNRPWTVVLRYPDQSVRELIAQLSIEAANNNFIGYDQNQRNTYWNRLKESNYRPSQIKTACEADCSAGVIANVKAAGYLKNIKDLKELKATYTGDMKSTFKKAGFQLLTASKYLKGFDYLMPGDILLYEGHHTATNLGIGKYTNYQSNETSVPTTQPSNVGKNLTSVSTKEIQTLLNKVGNYNLVVDGDYGAKTTAAVKDFQTKNNLEADGIVGNMTLQKLQSLNKKATQSSSIDKKGVVIADLLNVRKGAGKNYNNLTSYPVIKKGTEVQIVTEEFDNNKEKWYLVKINGNLGIKYGYVKAQFIKV